MTDEKQEGPKYLPKKFYETLRTIKDPKNKILFIRSFDVQLKQEEAEIQRLVDNFDIPDVGFISKVRKEMLEEQAKGKEIDSPEAEALWQEKLDKEKTEHLKKSKKAKEERQKNLDTIVAGGEEQNEPSPAEIAKSDAEAIEKHNILEDVKPKTETPLEEAADLTETQVTKLKEAGIVTVEAFETLEDTRVVEILGEIAAQAFIKKTPAVA